MGAHVGETRGVGHVRGLAGFGVGPAFALLEFHGVIVEELVDRDRRQDQRVRGRRCVRGCRSPRMSTRWLGRSRLRPYNVLGVEILVLVVGFIARECGAQFAGVSLPRLGQTYLSKRP